MPSLLRRLTSGTFYYGLGQFLPKLVRFLLLPVFTLFLTPEDYGILELTVAVGSLLAIGMRLGVPGSATRFYFDYREGPKLKDYITTLAGFLSFASLIIGGLALLVAPWVLDFVMPGLDYAPYFILIAIGTILSANYQLQLRLIQAREQASLAARLSISRAAISILLAVVFVVFLRLGATGMLMAETIVGGFFLLQAVAYLKPELRGRFQWGMLKSSLSYGLGVLPGHLMGTLSPLITRAWLSSASSVSAVGLLGIATRFAMPMTLAVTAFQRAFQPVYFAIRDAQEKEDVERLVTTVRDVWAGSLGLALAGGIGGPALIRLLTPAEYHEAAPLVTILTFGFLGHMAYTLLASEIFFQKKTWLTPGVSAASLVTTVAITALTVDRFGASGVAWANAGALITAALVAGTLAVRMVRLPHDWWSLGRSTALGLPPLIAALFLPEMDTFQQLLLCGGVLLGFAALLWLTGDPSIRHGWKTFRRLVDSGVPSPPAGSE